MEIIFPTPGAEHAKDIASGAIPTVCKKRERFGFVMGAEKHASNTLSHS